MSNPNDFLEMIDMFKYPFIILLKISRSYFGELIMCVSMKQLTRVESRKRIPNNYENKYLYLCQKLIDNNLGTL